MAASRGSARLGPQELRSKLRLELAEPRAVVMPCCHDALSALLIERQGFPLTFMSGFGVSASRGLPDTQLISYGEMVDAATSICAALQRTPVIGDGDTGYGNAVNVRRTVRGYRQAGLAGVMIEDQVAPKRCGHVTGKQVVGFDEAVQRMRAACDERDEGGDDIVIMARTDALLTDGLDEAIRRAKVFAECGADIIFVEALRTREEMQAVCDALPRVPKMVNLIDGGATPMLSVEELERIGFKLVARPVDLLLASVAVMQHTLARLQRDAGEPAAAAAGDDAASKPYTFAELKDVVGFPRYFVQEARYAAKKAG